MEDILEKMGLTQNEVNVYSIIVKFGPRTIGQIQSYVKLSATEIAETLEKLIVRGYITKIEAKNREGTPYYVPVPPPIKLTEDITAKLEKELKSITEALLQDWNNTMKALKEKLSELNNSVTERTQAHENIVEENSKKLLADTETILDGATKTIETVVSKISSEAETISASNSESFAKSIGRIENSIAETFDATIHKIGDFHDNFKSKIEETFETLKTEHKNRVMAHLEELQNTTSTLKQLVEEKYKAYEEEQERIKGLVSDKTTQTFDSLHEETKQIGKESNAKAVETLNKVIQQYEESTINYIERLKDTLSKLNEELQTVKETTSQKIEETITKSKEIVIEVLNSNEDQFVNVIDSTKKLAIEKLSEIIKQTGNKASEMKGQLEDNLKNYMKDFKTNSGNLVEQLTEGINSGFDQFKEGLSQAITELNEKIQGLKEELESYIDIFNTQFGENVENFSKSIKDILLDSVEKYKTLSSNIKAEKDAQITELNTAITIQVQEIFQKAVNQTAEAEKTFKESINSANENISTKKTEILDSIKETTESKKEELVQFLGTIASEFQKEVEEAKNRMNGTITSYIENVESLSQSFNEKQASFRDQVISHLSDIKTSVIDEIKNAIDENISNISNIIEKEQKEIEEDLANKGEDFDKQGREIRDRIPDYLDIAQRTIEEQLTEIKTNIDKTYQSIKEICSLFAELDEKKMQKAFGKEQGIELYHQIETLSSEINTQHNKLANELEDRKANLITTLSSVSEQSYSEINKKVEAFKEFVSQSQQSLKGQLNAIKETFTTNLEKVFTNLKGKSTETYDLFEKEFGDIHTAGVTEITEILGQEKESIQSTANEFIKTSEGVLGRIKEFSADTTIPELFDEHITNLEKLTGDMEKVSKTTLTNAEKELDKTIKEVHTSLNTAEKESKAKVSKLTTDLQQINKEIHANAISTLENVVRLADERLTSTIGNAVEEATKMSEQKKEELVQLVEDGTETLSTSQQQINEQLAEGNQKVIESLEGTIKENIKDHESSIDVLTNAISNTIEQLQTELSAAETALDTDVSKTLEKAMSGYKEQTKAVEEKISELITDAIANFTANADNLLGEFAVSPETNTKLEAIVNSMKEGLASLGKEYPKLLEKDKETFENSIQTKLREYQEKTQEHINELTQYVHTSLSNIYHEITKAITSEQSKMADKFEKTLNEYELNVAHQVNTFVTNSDSNSAALVTNIQSTKDSLIEAAETSKNSVKQDMSDFAKMASDVSSTALNDIKQKLTQIKKDAQVMAKDKNEYTKALQTFVTDYGRGSREKIAQMETEVSQILNSIPSKINEVLEASGESMKLIKTVLSLGEGTKPNTAEDLWLVVGKEQVEAALEGLLNHTKRSATIVSPDLSWLKPEVLAEYGKSLDLLSKESDFPAPLKKALEEREKKGIVRPIKRTTVPIEKIILGYRDGVEEGLIGCITPDGTPALLVTMNESLVETIGKTISLVRMGQF